jgi:hypothetical protein
MDGPNSFSLVADIGQWAQDHPPHTDYELPTGVQFAFQPYRDGFVVTDGHHNRVYKVGLDGKVGQLIAFPDIVPTGVQVLGSKIYMAEAGPVPHLPEDGKAIVLSPRVHHTQELAAGAPLLLDLKFDCHHRLFGLSQGVFPEDGNPGDPALPDTGSIVVARRDGSFRTIFATLNQPTSFQILGDTAYVFTLNGEIWKVSNVVCPTCD